MNTRLVGWILTAFVVSVPLVAWAVEVGVALTLPHLLGLAVIAAALPVWRARWSTLLREPAVVALLAFGAVAALSVVLIRLQPEVVVLGESTYTKSLKQLIGLGYAMGLFLALFGLLSRPGRGLALTRVHYWTTAGVGALAIVQFLVACIDLTSPLANLPVSNSTMGAQRPLSLMYGFPRISLTLIEPSTLATYLLTGWAFWLFVVDHPPVPERWQRRFAWSGVMLGTAVIVTGSRMAYGVFALLVILALATRPRRVYRTGLVAASLLCGLALTGPVHGTRLVATLLPKSIPSAAPAPARPRGTGSARARRDAPPRVEAEPPPSVAEVTAEQVEAAAGTLDVSVQQRAASYLVTLEVLRRHPWLGTGFGTSSFYMERFWPDGFIPLPIERVAAATMMSQYATILTETGLIGALAIAAFGGALLLRLYRVGRGSERQRALACGLAAAMASYAIGALATSLIVYQFLLIWLLCALALTADVDREVSAPRTAGDATLGRRQSTAA